MPVRFVLLFDSDCGICSFFARAVKLIDLGGRIEAVPLSAPRADPWFAHASKEDRFGSFHVVRPSGERTSRGRALVALIGALPLGAGLARFVSAMPSAIGAAERLYDLVVRYRGFLAGLPTKPGAT